MSDSAGLLDEILDRVRELPDDVRQQLISDAHKVTVGMAWVPNPGPQTDAYNCEADELFYGGSAGGGKSDLTLGLALTQHTRSLLLRRTKDDARDLAERALEIIDTRDGYNSQQNWLRYQDRLINFSGCQQERDKQRWKGRARDLYGFDEIGDFLETQYTFIIGWNRSADKNQRCRIVCTGNPPTTPEGLWVIKRWAAWLDPAHPKYGKVKNGEPLWYTTIKGRDTEMDGPGPHTIEGEAEPIIARSRTFIRGMLEDNPDLAETNYDSALAALPERERLAYREGRFDVQLKDKSGQIIPTAWVREAQARWSAQPPIGIPMCVIAADCCGGGTDPLMIGWRHDGWFSEFIEVKAEELDIKMIGRQTAGHIIMHRRNKAHMVIDLGGGYGLPAYEHLKENFEESEIDPRVHGYKGAEGTQRRSSDHQFGFNNTRSWAMWMMREALDPGQAGGSPIMLPPDSEMLGDLTAVTYQLKGSTIHAEPKVNVCAKLGRSTNKGDTVIMAWTKGPTASTDGAAWDEVRREVEHRGRSIRPKVVSGRHNARRR